MKIKTAAILGAGAIGAYFIWGLSEKLGGDLWVIADGERKERLLEEGLVINQKSYTLHIKTPEEAKGVDLLFVATKYGALPAVLDDIETIADEHTIVLSLLNGVDSEEMIGARIGMEHMVYSFMQISSERSGNQITFDGPITPGLFYGEAEKTEPTERVLAIAELLEGTGIHFTICDDIKKQIWLKYATNVSQNQPQAMISCGFGAYEDSSYVSEMRDKLRAEVVEVAKAKGIDLSISGSDSGKRAPILKKARFSTLQDLDAKRHTEVDMFAGAMVRMGKELGIPTPYNEFTFYMIKALEEKNDGKFDYE